MPFLSQTQIRTAASTAALSLMLGFFSVLLPVAATPAHAAYNDSSCDLVSLSTLGSGQAVDPYVLTNADQLWEVTDCTTDSARVLYFELGNDIDVSNASAGVPTTSPIGFQVCDSNSKRFRGVLDGKGYSISGLAITATSCGVGLFGAIRSAEIKNLSLFGAMTSSGSLPSSTPHFFSGALAQYSEFVVTISNVINHVAIDSEQYIGGIIGYVGGDTLFEETINHGRVRSTKTTAYAYDLGGFAAYAPTNVSVTFVSCVNEAEVGGDTLTYVQRAGGFVGKALGVLVIRDSTNSGNVRGNAVLGGFIGNLSSTNFSITGSSNYGDVTSNGSPIGGLIGYVSGGTNFAVSDSANYGSVHSNASDVGGLTGEIQAMYVTISNFVNEGLISATSMEVGGLIGWVRSGTETLSIRESHNRGAVSAGWKVGGFIGLTDAGVKIELDQIVNTATVSSTTTNASYNADVGGIIGKSSPGTGVYEVIDISRVWNSGAVSARRPVAGGFIGSTTTRVTISISQSINSGQISGSDLVAGIIGWSEGQLMISDSYNSGAIKASTGGLSGGLSADIGNGPVTASHVYSSDVGAIDGLFLEGNVTPYVAQSYVLTWSEYVSTSSTVEFQTLATFQGWNFTTIWGMPSCSVNNGYPVLRWAYPNETFYDLSCGVNSTPAVAPSTPSTPSTPATSAPQPYRGPLITSAQKIAYQGEIAVLDGLRLDSVSEAYVLSVQLEILSATSTSITLAVSTSTELGIQDLVFISSYGRLTTMAALDIREAPQAASNSSELLGYAWTFKFSGNSRDLDTKQKDGTIASTAKFPGASTVICWGYTTASEPNAWAMEQANARASSVCASIAESNPTVKTVVRIRTGMPKSAAMRVAMQFWQTTATD